MNRNDKLIIEPNHPNLILTEGADAYYFLCNYCNHIIHTNKHFENFKIYNYGGINELTRFLYMLTKIENFNIVKSISIIRDAESNGMNAIKSIKTSLKAANLACPDELFIKKIDKKSKYPNIMTGYILFPDCNSTPTSGTLENLCLKQLADKEADKKLKEIDQFLDKYKTTLPRIHKNQLHSYFSLTDQFVSLKIGEAARANAFNLDDGPINNINKFLMQFIDENTNS